MKGAGCKCLCVCVDRAAVLCESSIQSCIGNGPCLPSPTVLTDPEGKKTTVADEESGHTLTCSQTQPIKPQGSGNQRPAFPNFILKYLGSSTPEATGR